jgi:hypothetical protein
VLDSNLILSDLNGLLGSLEPRTARYVPYLGLGSELEAALLSPDHIVDEKILPGDSEVLWT